jgi:hypothetical protein
MLLALVAMLRRRGVVIACAALDGIIDDIGRRQRRRRTGNMEERER